MQPTVSIVIVNYNTCDLLRNCLKSIFNYSKEISIEIIVVDNASADKSGEMVQTEFPTVKWIQTGYNAGFARANNVGIRAATGQYVLLLNSDTEFFETTLSHSLRYHQESEAKRPTGLTSCRMVDDTGKVLLNSNTDAPFFVKLWEGNPMVILFKSWFGIEYKNYLEIKTELHGKEHEALWIGGAFALFNAEIFKKHNFYLDEDFFMYAEDIEWCNRISEAGFRHFFHTETTVLHYDGGSPVVSKNKLAQITISVWLCLRKVKGLPYYLAYIGLFALNFLLDGFFFWFGKVRRKPSAQELDAKQQRDFLWQLAKRYFWKIGFEFSKQPSKSKEYLKYAPPQN